MDLYLPPMCHGDLRELFAICALGQHIAIHRLQQEICRVTQSFCPLLVANRRRPGEAGAR